MKNNNLFHPTGLAVFWWEIVQLNIIYQIYPILFIIKLYLLINLRLFLHTYFHSYQKKLTNALSVFGLVIDSDVYLLSS